VINPGLEGKIVVVTGANNPQGIGAAVARAFAAQGATILLHYLRVPTDARIAMAPDEVLRAIDVVGGRARAWESDLADPATIPRLFDDAVGLNLADHVHRTVLRRRADRAWPMLAWISSY